MEPVNISFRLKPGRDDEVINWICDLGDNDRSYFIREAIKFYIKHNSSSELSSALTKHTPTFPQSLNSSVARDEEREVTEDKKEVSEKDLESALDSWID